MVLLPNFIFRNTLMVENFMGKIFALRQSSRNQLDLFLRMAVIYFQFIFCWNSIYIMYI